METESRMSARCGKRLLVHSEQGEWKLNEACPDGHQPGLRVGALLDKCTKCKQAPPMEGRIPMAVVERPKKGNGASTSTASLNAEVPLVAPSGVPTVAPPPPPSAATVSIPPAPAFVAPDALPLQPTTGAVLPFSVAVEPSSADPVVLPPAMPEVAPPAAAPLPASIVSPAPSLPDIGKIVLPGGFSLESMMDPEASVDVDAVVKAGMPNLPGGPSTGGLSPHTLDDAKCWRLFYLRHVLGLKPAAPSRSLQLGSLIHYCLAARYLLGAEYQYQPCTLVAQAGAAGLAAEAKALVEGMVAKYGIEEWERWCVRAVEHNLVAFIECPVGGRTVRLPATCRIDLILGLKAPHEPHPAGGPMAEGVYIEDHKTCSSMTKDLLEGYGLDWQFNAQAVIFEEGGYSAVFGPLRGTLVNLLSKSRKTPTADSFARPQAPMSKGLVAEFRDTQLRPLMGEVYRRISDEAVRKDPAQWPKDYRQCNGRWGRCHYFEICEGGHETVSAAFVDDESLVIHPDKFVRPAGPAAPPAEQVKKERAKEKAQAKASDPIAIEMARLWGSMLVEQIEVNAGGAYTNLQRGHFLQPDTTKEKVIVLLGNELKLFYDLFVAQKVKQEWAGATWQFTKTGISWQRADGGRGRLTWKGLATWICDNVWYDLSKAMPEG